MSNWNFGGTRLNGVSDPGVLDLKALLNQVTGGTLGTSLGGLSAAVGSGNRTVGGGGHSSSHRLGSGGYPNPAGVIGGGIGGGSSCLDGGSGGNNGASPFFDPFSSMSTFGFFNPKDPGGNNLRDASGGTGGGGGGHHLNSGGMGHSNKSPTYHSSTNNSHSPVFGGSHSPINFFGGGSGGGGSNHQQQQQHNNHFSSSTNSSYANTDKFPISTFSINDTIPGRERDNSSSMFSNSDDISSNGHNSHFGNNSSHFGNSNNYRGGDRGDRDNRDNYNNSNSSSSNHNNHHQGHPANATTNNRSNEHGENSFNQGVRETGIIEKLLHSYGFIQCCERQARLFFHFSQFDGTIEHLKLGDPVEFEMTYDRRTGKPIASAVTKIGPEVVLSEERVTGTVTTELHHESNGELQGRISYENRGECFFLPYCKEDIEGNVSLSVGDTVSFQIATNQRSGNLTARYCRLENPARPVRYKGIVSSLKDNFGFIERADVAKEIFFHFSETRINEAITVNDNVEFNIQTRNGKEVACTITKLPTGTVVFEDIGTDTLKGQILKPIDKTQCPSPTLGPTPRSESAEGRLRYRGPDRQELEVVYGEKDQRGSFTMKHGDWVQFQLAIDRRNKQQRATNVHLLEESFSVSGERREEGVVSAIKGDCGFITCAERDSKMFFRFSELLDYTREPRIADDVEFTIIQDSTSPIRQSAIRIKYLKHGTVQFELPVSQGLHGVVVREPSTPWVSQEALVGILPSLSNLGLPPNVTERLIQSLSSAEVLSQLTGASNDAQGEPGVIQYTTSNGWQQDTIIFHWKDCKNLRNIRVGTKVVFDIHQVRRNRDFVAANIRAESGSDLDSPTGNSSSNLGNNLLQTFRLSPTSHLGSGNCLNGPVGSGRQSPPLSSAMGNMLNSILGGGGGNSSMNSANEANHVNDLLNSAQAQIMAEKLENCSNNSMDNNHLGFSNNSGSNRSLAGSVGEIGSSRNHSIVVSGGGSGSYGTTLTSMHNNNAESNSNNTGSNCINMGLNLSHGLGENQRENQNQRAISPIQQQQQQQNGSLYNSSSLSSTEFDDLALDSDQLRRTSRSPSDSSVEKMMLNRSMYSGYAPDESPSPPHSSSNSKSPRVVMKGYIAALKDGFGFIETMAQDGEIFFHSSSLVGDFAAIEVGQEVEYVVSSKASSSGKNAADIVKPLPKGSIGRAAVFPDILQGAVVRPLRGANPDQTEYTGLIDGQDGQAYPFGIISMLNKKELLQSGEDVEFQLDAQQKPVNIRAIRKKLRAAVEAVKGQYGFLSYELEDGKKLFFHMSEVKDHQHLNPGDEVEFVILQNPRNGKSSACSVVKVGYVPGKIGLRESQRPERLLNRLSKLSVDETAPRLVVVRQPFGPDGTRGFSQPRVARKPGSLSSSRDSTSSTGSN